MLLKNDLVALNGTAMRILDIDHSQDLCWMFPVDDEKGLPIAYRHSQIAHISPLTGTVKASTKNPSPTAIRRANKSWKRIEPLVANSAIYDPQTRNQLILDQANAIGCSPTTILKDLRRYWAGGQTMAALMGRFQNSGRVAEDGPIHQRGRKPKYGEHDESYLVTRADKKNFDKIIRKHYLKDRTVSVPAAYQRLVESHYSYLDGNQVRQLKPDGERPSLRQFRYFLLNNYSLEERLRHRLSDKDFERNNRPVTGYDLQDCLGIGHIYEIDATIADVWLVATKDKARIIGKPTLYLIYDKFSRLIVGFYVGLEAASWPAARHAIVSIAEDKAALCRRYGIQYNPSDWPATGAYPQTFVGDRGEMFSKNSSLLATNMSIIVRNPPSLRPDRKGTVECGFKLIQQTMADSVAGYEPPDNPKKRRGKKYDKDACLNLDEFTAVLMKAIIKHNRSVMKGYPLTAEMLSQGVRPIPTELWAEDLKRRTGALTRFDEEFVRFALLPEDKATVTREGIRFRGCYYTCSEAMKRHWLVNAGQRKFTLDISYDKRLVDNIYIHDDTSETGYIEAVLTPRSADYKGLSFDEVDAYERLRAELRHEAEQTNTQERSHFHADIDPIVAQAKKEAQQVTKGKTRASRKKDIAPDRLEERRARRQQEVSIKHKTITPDKTADVVPFASKKKSVPSDLPAPTATSLTDRLRQKHQEMLNG